MSTTQSTKKTLEALKTTLAVRPPYCSGTCPIPVEELALYYGRDENARHIDFSNITDHKLEHLSQACDPATFGVGQEDVLDETYRKAGKMDVANFATKFSVERSGLLKLIRSDLLEGESATKGINVELYKLNVYGKDSFFKSHQDTPRSPDMFGSLVIVLPTVHEGGALVLRHGGKEWTFDSAKELSEQSQPSIGYVAFYSDIEHEVTLVKSGYRVTLTYNLYFSVNDADDKPAAVLPVNYAVSAIEATFRAALSNLLADESVLPTGGTLGFGLRHEYPVNADTKLATLNDRLKGSDAIVKRACNQLSLVTSLKVMYQEKGYPSPTNIMTDRFADLSRRGEIESVWEELSSSEYGGVSVYSSGEEIPAKKKYDRETRQWVKEKPLEIYWATELTKFTTLKNEFVAYGNQASLAYLYGRVFLIAQVGPPGHRSEL